MRFTREATTVQVVYSARPFRALLSVVLLCVRQYSFTVYVPVVEDAHLGTEVAQLEADVAGEDDGGGDVGGGHQEQHSSRACSQPSLVQTPGKVKTHVVVFY